MDFYILQNLFQIMMECQERLSSEKSKLYRLMIFHRILMMVFSIKSVKSKDNMDRKLRCCSSYHFGLSMHPNQYSHVMSFFWHEFQSKLNENLSDSTSSLNEKTVSSAANTQSSSTTKVITVWRFEAKSHSNAHPWMLNN